MTQETVFYWETFKIPSSKKKKKKLCGNRSFKRNIGRSYSLKRDVRFIKLRKMGIDTNEAIFNFFDILTKNRIISLLVQCPKKQTFYEVWLFMSPVWIKYFFIQMTYMSFSINCWLTGVKRLVKIIWKM